MIEIKEILKNGTFRMKSGAYGKGEPTKNQVDESYPTHHFGLFNDDLIGIISLYENKNPIFKDPIQIQLRGLDILEEYQSLLLGEKLIESCEAKLKLKKNNLLIWFNARKTSVVSYEKLGYQTIGDIFKIKGIGEHFIMFKKLNV
jgi:GNAT superfamily N-acetyltransferase